MNQKPFFDNVALKELKLWKVDIALKEENEKLDLINTKINVSIKEELGGAELLPLSKICKHFPSQPADEHIHIIVQRLVETKEVHYTATYGRKSKKFQWTLTRGQITLSALKVSASHMFCYKSWVWQWKRNYLFIWWWGFGKCNLDSRIQGGAPNRRGHM